MLCYCSSPEFEWFSRSRAVQQRCSGSSVGRVVLQRCCSCPRVLQFRFTVAQQIFSGSVQTLWLEMMCSLLAVEDLRVLQRFCGSFRFNAGE